MTEDTDDHLIGTAVEVDGDKALIRLGPPTCPECHKPTWSKRAHATGCPNWGMLYTHWQAE